MTCYSVQPGDYVMLCIRVMFSCLLLKILVQISVKIKLKPSTVNIVKNVRIMPDNLLQMCLKFSRSVIQKSA